MKPLYVLLVTFAVCLAATWLIGHQADWRLSGRIAMSVMMLFTASGHFAFPKGMAMMLPSFVPYKVPMVYFSGIIEIAAAAGLLIPSLQHATAWLLILFFVLILPANIHAALKRVDYRRGTYEGPGPCYLWLRVPLQIVFIAWVYWSAAMPRVP